MFRKIVTFLFLILTLLLYGQDYNLIVDFGTSSESNVFNVEYFPGWNNLELSDYSNYTASGPGGLTMIANEDGYSSWQKISSNQGFEFQEGDAIILTWYNGTGGVVSMWRPLLSFTDENKPDATEGEPQWYAMEKYGLPVDVRVNYLYPEQTVKTVHIITSAETTPGLAAPTAGIHNLINISFNDPDYHGLVLDKIEYMPAAISKPLPTENVQAVLHPETPYSRINLSWDHVDSVNGVEVNHYKIYRNGVYTAKTEDTFFTDCNLESGKNYAYTIKAVNVFENHSDFSPEINIATTDFPGSGNLINPADIAYLGAFKLPADTENSNWNYRSGGLAYYPKGDPDNIDNDYLYKGSLYATGHTYDRYAAEISIPEPLIADSYDQLPTAQTIQDFHLIEPENSMQVSYAYVGLTYLPQNEKFYSTFYYWYNVSFTKRITHGAFEPDFSQVYGGWWIGDSTNHSAPCYDTYAKFLEALPTDWADENTGGKYLLSGGQRAGSSPDGPGLVAVKPWEDDPAIAPQPYSELDFTFLLQYGTDGKHTMDGWIENDYFNGAALVNSGNKQAFIFSGQKAYGDYYYGYVDGSLHADHCNNVPVTHCSDGGGKGGQARSYRAMLVFYNPDDLARVAKSHQGIYQEGDAAYLLPHEPQPYAALDIDDFLLKENTGCPASKHRLEGLTYDADRNLLYLAEPDAYSTKDIIHVFKVSSPSDLTENDGLLKERILLKQNYPNPFNPVTTISFQTLSDLEAKLQVYNVKGELVFEGLSKNYQKGLNRVKFSANNLAAGLYYYVLKGKTWKSKFKQMLILK